MEAEPQKSSAFPRPPPFYQQFSEDNLKQLEQIHKDRAQDYGSPIELQLNDVSPHLQYLLPPPPPIGTYTVFGEQYGGDPTIPPLPEDVERLIPSQITDAERPQYLLHITKSILLNYLDLVGCLVQDPDYAKTKVEDLRVLYSNAHQLINEYRPHQARESLITMMEQQLQKKKDEVAGVKLMKERVNARLGSLGDVANEAEPESDMSSKKLTEAEVLSRERQRDAWRVLEAMEV